MSFRHGEIIFMHCLMMVNGGGGASDFNGRFKLLSSCYTYIEMEDKTKNLEKLGFLKAMTALREKGVNTTEVVSDAHMQISSLISEYHQSYKKPFRIKKMKILNQGIQYRMVLGVIFFRIFTKCPSGMKKNNLCFIL